MKAILGSMAAVLAAAAALGVMIVGVNLLIPLSSLDVPQAWIVPLALGLLASTGALALILFTLSDRLVRRLIATAGGHGEFAPTHKRCSYCHAELELHQTVCQDCGTRSFS